MTFLDTSKAVWILSAVAFIALFWGSERGRRRRLERFVGSFADRLRYGPSDRARAWGRSFIVAGAALAALALMRPTWGFRWVEVPSQGRDLYVLLDISKSMLAQDVAPNRLTWAKRKVIDLTQLAPGHRLGVIAFAGGAYLACPLTSDAAALSTMLDNLGPESTTSGGTAIGLALELAQSRLKKQGGGAVLLLSDGEDHDGGAEAAAARLGEAGIPVYALGVGRPEGAPLPEPGGGFKKGSSGEVILSRLDERALTRIASAGKGRYLRSEVGDADLKGVLADWTGSGEDAASGGGRKQKPEERFQWPLALVLLFWLVEVRLQEGRAAARAGWRLPWRRGAVALLLWLSTLARASTADSLYEKGKFDEAEKLLLDRQVRRPNDGGILYDLGNAYYRQGKFEEGERAFGQAAEKLEGPAKQHAHYNRGNAAFRQQRYPDAIGHYETAVALDPKDEDAKYNLALAKKRLQEQQQQKQQDKNQQQNPKNQKDQDQKPPQDQKEQGAKQEQDNDKGNDQDKDKKESPQQAQKQDQKERKGQQAKAGEGEKKPAGAMDEQEAQALLERVKEFRVKKKPESRKGAPRDGKDW